MISTQIIATDVYGANVLRIEECVGMDVLEGPRGNRCRTDAAGGRRDRRFGVRRTFRSVQFHDVIG
jgi:hypothetical protein